MLASVDIGTNSVRLFVGTLSNLDICRHRQELRITRLGQGVDNSGNLAPEGMKRTLNALKEYKEIVDTEYSSVPVRLVATSAVRDAANRQEFVEQVQSELGWQVQLLSGWEEARLSYLGAVAAISGPRRPTEALVLDIGGGSTELIWGSGRDVLDGTSVQMGSVRMTERFVSQHPIPCSERRALFDGIERELGPIGRVAKNTNAPLLAVGGTATTAASVYLELADYDPARVTGYEMAVSELQRMFRRLADMDLEQRLRLPGLTPGREDVFVAGLAILIKVLSHSGRTTMVVSDGDLLQGVFLAEAER